MIPVNTILGIEEIMEKRNENRSKKKLTTIYIGVGIAVTSGFLFMVWLIASRIWWGLAVYICTAIVSLLISAFVQKDNVFICPKCDTVFKPPLKRAFFSTGDHKVRWMTCPECGHKDWCVVQRQKRG
jgi:predicted RNA-binding Zn-ribbon protein involved in translation (DUF1610 family)